MQTNGLDLGENQTKLLAKIEELTLYLIDKDKELSEEKQTINSQQRQLDAQNAHLQSYKQQFQAMSLAIKQLQNSITKR
ncbi:MAG: hypothetical protein ACTHMI_22205 [Mucilaginibacter sp.]